MMQIVRQMLRSFPPPVTRRLMSSINQVNPTQEPDLILSDSCVDRIRSVVDEREFLRIEVTGGGCSGFQYKFAVDSELQEDDVVVDRNGSRVVVDRTSLDLIRGSVIDYRQELIRNAFVVSKNPKAEKGCSCGASFTLKTDP